MRKIGLVLIISIALNICAFSAQAESPERQIIASPDTGLIKGKVTDTNTPIPNNLADATIIAESELLLGTEARLAETDTSGNYEIVNLSPGEYVVTTSKEGYDESVEYVTVIPGGDTFHDVRLYKTDTIIGMFGGGRIYRLLLVLCLIVAYIYIRKRYRSTRSQDR